MKTTHSMKQSDVARYFGEGQMTIEVTEKEVIFHLSGSSPSLHFALFHEGMNDEH